MRKLWICLLIIGFPGYASASSLLVLGDSIAAGYGLQRQEASWVSLLSDKLQPHGWTVINAGLSGDTTTGGLARLDRLLLRHKPDFTLLELGGNDGLLGIPIAHIRNNLAQIIARLQSQGSGVMLVGITLPPNYGRRYIRRFERMYVELAQTEELPFLSLTDTAAGTDPAYLQADRIHPNAAAQPLLANAVWQHLAAALELKQ